MTITEAVRARMDVIEPLIRGVMSSDAFIAALMTEFAKAPDLAKCTPASVIGACYEISKLGLRLGHSLGHAYLIPRRNGKAQAMEANFQIGYKGMIHLARLSGQLESIEAAVVYEKDFFEAEKGLDRKLRHVPTDDPERGQPVKVYAIARLRGGGVQYDWAPWHEMMALADSKVTGPVWRAHPEEMAKKTMIRRVLKYCSLSPEMTRAVHFDELAEAGIPQGTHDRGEQLEPGDNEAITVEQIPSELDELLGGE